MMMEVDQTGRALPISTTQLAGHAVSSVVGGLTPAMLGVLLLNVVGIGAAVYFLNILIVGQQSHLKSLLEVQNKQQTEIIVMHQREFDAMLAMVPRIDQESLKALLAPPHPPTLPMPAPEPETPARGKRQ